MNATPITYPQEDRWSYLWLLIGVLLSMISWAALGRWVIPLAAWLSNVFVLRYMRAQRRVWLAYLVLGIAAAAYMLVALPDFLSSIRLNIVVGGALAGS